MLAAYVLIILIVQVVADSRSIKNENTTTKETCDVVLYDNIKWYLNWHQKWFTTAVSKKCKTAVTVRERFDSNVAKVPGATPAFADVVVFHAPTHRTSDVSWRVIKTRRDGSKPLLAILTMEQPKYAKVMNQHAYIDKTFDLVISYSLSSVYPNTRTANLPITYYPLNILSPNAVMHEPRPFNEKRGLHDDSTVPVHVAAFISNCKAAGASARGEYVAEMMKHIAIHSFGNCNNNVKEPILAKDPLWPDVAQRRARKVKLLSKYKFYLAFENSPVVDYVSEKVFEGESKTYAYVLFIHSSQTRSAASQNTVRSEKKNDQTQFLWSIEVKV